MRKYIDFEYKGEETECLVDIDITFSYIDEKYINLELLFVNIRVSFTFCIKILQYTESGRIGKIKREQVKELVYADLGRTIGLNLLKYRM